MLERFIIQNFRYGLDTRREQLVSQPGTLAVIQNAHIDVGGEIDKRKAFTATGATLKLPAGTYGFQDTDTGAMVFGSASPGSIGTLPTGVVYQQLQSPFTDLTMTGVVFSTAYRGKAFVIATFSDGVETGTYVFYNGALVSQITDGVVGITAPNVPELPQNLATDLAGIVNRVTDTHDLGSLGWLADANKTSNQPSDNTGYHETALNGSVLVMSPPGIHFTPTITNNNSVSGTLGVKLIDQNYKGVSAVASYTAFKINAGTTGDNIQVSAPKQKGSQSPAFDLTNGNVPFNASLGQTATDVATAINNNTFVTGYTAIANNVSAVVTVYAPPSFGLFTLNLVVTTTGTMTTTNSGVTPGNQFVITFNPSTVDVIQIANFPKRVYGNVSTASQGAIGTVTYLWEEVDVNGTLSPGASGIAMAYTDSSGNIFSAFLGVNTAKQGYFRLTATDSGAASGSPWKQILSVRLELDSSN